jgi:hypothetical protein
MSRRRSIGERLARARSPALRREIAAEWAQAWREDHARTLAAAREALRRGDRDEAGRRLGQIEAIIDKAGCGLTAVIEAMEDVDDRER